MALAEGGGGAAATKAGVSSSGGAAHNVAAAAAILACSGAATQLAITDAADPDSSWRTGIWRDEGTAWVHDDLYFGPASRTLPADACTDDVFDARGRLLPSFIYRSPQVDVELYETWINITPAMDCAELPDEPQLYDTSAPWLLEQWEDAAGPAERSDTDYTPALEQLDPDDPLGGVVNAGLIPTSR